MCSANAHLGVEYRAGRARLVRLMYCATHGASGRCGLQRRSWRTWVGCLQPVVQAIFPYALVWAARSGQPDAVDYLVKRGGDPNATAGVNGWTVLMHAIHKDQPQSVAALLKTAPT